MAAAARPRGGSRQAARGELERHLQLQRGPRAGILALRLDGGRRRRRGSGVVDGGNLIGEQLFNLVHAGDGVRCAVLLLGQRGAPFDPTFPKFDDGTDRLRLRPGDRLGGVGLQLQRSDETLGVDAATFLEVGLAERLLPGLRQRREPPFQGFRGIRTIGRSRGRHRRDGIKPARFPRYNPQSCH